METAIPTVTISPTGTSISSGISPEEAREPAKLAAFIKQKVQQKRQELTKEDFLKQISAETHGLFRINQQPGEKAYLLASDTEDGRICAEAVKSILEEDMGLEVKLISVEGLQVLDATRFRKEGLLKLFEELNRIRQEHPADYANLLINATGGFKSVIPYITLFGLIQRIPCSYVFERSANLIQLPAAPVNFDFEALAPVSDAMDKLVDQGTMSAQEFRDLLNETAPDASDWYDCLVEQEEDLVGPSPLGLLWYYKKLEATRHVYLSPNAKKALEKSSGKSREQFLFMLNRLNDPSWRQQHDHGSSNHCKEIKFYKPGNTSERTAAYLKGSYLFVCELLQHDAYEDYRNSKEAVMERYPRGDFELFVPGEYESVDFDTEEEQFAQLQQRLEKAQSRGDRLEKEKLNEYHKTKEELRKLVEAKDELQTFSRNVEQARDQALEEARKWKEEVQQLLDNQQKAEQEETLEKTCQDLQQKNDALTRELLEKESALEELRKPRSFGQKLVDLFRSS